MGHERRIRQQCPHWGETPWLRQSAMGTLAVVLVNVHASPARGLAGYFRVARHSGTVQFMKQGRQRGEQDSRR